MVDAQGEPTPEALHEMPEMDMSRAVRIKNPYLARIQAEERALETEEDLGAEPARTTEVLWRAAESVRALGGLVCDGCLLARTVRSRGHAACKRAWMARLSEEARQRALALRNASGATCKITLEGTFNGCVHKISLTVGAPIPRRTRKARA